MNFADLDACVRSLRAEMVDFTSELVAIASENPPGNGYPDCVRAVTGKAPRFEMCPGLLEIRFYAEQGMPAYAYGPGLLAISHGPKESVDTDRIVGCAAIYARIAASVLHVG